jgi:hypothetical protein
MTKPASAPPINRETLFHRLVFALSGSRSISGAIRARDIAQARSQGIKTVRGESTSQSGRFNTLSVIPQTLCARMIEKIAKTATIRNSAPERPDLKALNASRPYFIVPANETPNATANERSRNLS